MVRLYSRLIERLEDERKRKIMEVQEKIFYTLKDYLEWLEEEWNTFDIKLYTLEDYLAMGEYVWNEENAQN
jgi:hypothetical protein